MPLLKAEVAKISPDGHMRNPDLCQAIIMTAAGEQRQCRSGHPGTADGICGKHRNYSPPPVSLHSCAFKVQTDLIVTLAETNCQSV